MIGLKYLISLLKEIFLSAFPPLLGFGITPNKSKIDVKRRVGRPSKRNALRRNVKYQTLMKRRRRLEKKKDKGSADWSRLNHIGYQLREIREGLSYD